MQSLAHGVNRHNTDHSIYPGENKDKLDVNVLRRLRACAAIAVLADTGTTWETKTAVSAGVYGASRAAGFEETSLDGTGPAVQSEKQKLLEIRAREERQRGVQRLNVEVRIAQARDEVPAEDVRILTELLTAVDQWHVLGVVPTEGKPQFRVWRKSVAFSVFLFFNFFFQFKWLVDGAHEYTNVIGCDEIDNHMMPQIIRLCEPKIMALLERFPLIECAWKEMLDPSQPYDTLRASVPPEVQVRFHRINLLIGAAINPRNTRPVRVEYLVRLIKECYIGRREIERFAQRLDAMERNWAHIINENIRRAASSKTYDVDPKVYEKDVFGGWNSCRLYELDGEQSADMEGECLRRLPVSERAWYERPLNKFSVSQSIIREYAARKGVYSSLLPQYTDGHPLNPVTRFYGQLGKYYQAAYTLLGTPVFPHPGLRSKNTIVRIRVVPVPGRYFPTACTVNNRPDVPESFDDYVELEKERFEIPLGLYGKNLVKNMFRQNWDNGKAEEHCYLHPEMKLIMMEVVNFRYVRILSTYWNQQCQRTETHRLLSQFKGTIGTSRDPCFSCRAWVA